MLQIEHIDRLEIVIRGSSVILKISPYVPGWKEMHGQNQDQPECRERVFRPVLENGWAIRRDR